MSEKAVLTKRIRYTKPGETIIVPLGMGFPHAVKIERMFSDFDGQLIGMGKTIKMNGCSEYRLNEKVGICLGWQ